MNWKSSFFIIFVSLLSCSKGKIEEKTPLKSSFLISADELLAKKNKTSFKILDFRKLEDYNKEHIVDAIQIWRSDIEDKSFPYGGMMASAKQIEMLFSEMGIQSSDTIIIYDNKGLCEAARLWWVLQNYNFTNVKLLEGGLKKWKSIKGKTSKIKPVFAKSNFKFPTVKSMKYYISKEEVKNRTVNTILIDTRSIEEYTGKLQKKGAKKAGRILNSKHIDWAETIDFHGDQSLKSIAELEKIYQKLNLKKTDSIILYCHSGVRSAHTTFVLTQLLNYKNVRNYDGSWTEWSYFEDLPYETGNLIN